MSRVGRITPVIVGVTLGIAAGENSPYFFYYYLVINPTNSLLYPETYEEGVSA
jgi:hypothetical protein